MKSLIVSIFLLISICSGYYYVYAACCAWTDRDACSSCPEGYYSGCVTEGKKCDCDCAESASEAAEKFSFGNYEIQKYIEGNFQKIVKDTRRYRFHDFKGIKISITSP